MQNISLILYTKGFFGSVLKSPTQMGSLSINNSVTNISRLGTFKSLRKNIQRKIHSPVCPPLQDTLSRVLSSIHVYDFLKGTVSQDFLLPVFFHESSSPKHLKKHQSKICIEIRKARCTTGIKSTTPVANLPRYCLMSATLAANLPPVLSTPVANLPLVSTTPAVNFVSHQSR